MSTDRMNRPLREDLEYGCEVSKDGRYATIAAAYGDNDDFSVTVTMDDRGMFCVDIIPPTGDAILRVNMGRKVLHDDEDYL